MPFESLPPADRRILSEMMSRMFNPLANPVMGVMGQSAGPYGQRNSTIQLPKDVFLAKITDVSGTGFAALYSFVEMQIKSDGTGLEETFNGRVAICCAGSGSDLAIRPARYILDDTLTEDTLVLARVSIAESNEFEILGVLGGSGGGISTGGCSGELGWLLDTASLTLSNHITGTLPRAMAVAVLESKGRCACIAAPAGDSAALRFFDALDNPDSPYHDNPFAALEPQEGDTQLLAKWNGSTAWEMMGTLAACCGGCMTATFAINVAATLLLSRPIFTVTIYKGCKDASDTNPENPPPKTFTMWAECGNDGYVILSGFDNQACQFDPVDQCVSLFRIGLVCTRCRLPVAACKFCKEGIGPSVWKLVEGSRVRWLHRTGECTWAEGNCGDATVTINCDTLRVTTEDAIYESTSTTGFNCLATHTVNKVSGSGSGSGSGSPSSVTLTPFLCSTATGADLGSLTVSTDVAPTCQWNGTGGSALSNAAMSMDGLSANYTQGGGLTSDPCDDLGSQKNSCKGWGFGLTYLGENRFLVYPICNIAESACSPGLGACYSGPSEPFEVENSATYPDVLLDFDIVVVDAACDDAPRTIGTTVTNM